MLTYYSQGHLLDETDVQSPLTGEFDQIQHLIFIAPLEHHRVELDTTETGTARRLYTRQNLFQPPGAGQLSKALWLQGIQADVEPGHASTGQILGHPRQLGAVGRQHQLPRQAPKAFDQREDITPHQGFTAGEADLAYAQAGECGGHGVKLLKGEDFVARQKFHFLCHAVDAAEITAIGDRQAKIVDAATETVDQL